MNGTPRALNRILLALLGLIFLAGGAVSIVLAVAADVNWWHRATAAAARWLERVFAATTMSGQKDSWLWIVICLLLLVLIALMIAWVASQGRGRGSVLLVDADGGGATGAVAISAMVPEQALRTALLARPELAGATVTTYEVRGYRGLKIRVVPRQGVAPCDVTADVTDLLLALDDVLGVRTPVVISMAAGARSRFVRAERVQ